MAKAGASCENGFRGALSVGAVPETVAARLGAGKQRTVFTPPPTEIQKASVSIKSQEPTSFRFSLEDVLLLIHCLDAADFTEDQALQNHKHQLQIKLNELRKVLGGSVQ